MLIPGPVRLTLDGALAPGWRGPRGAPLDPYALVLRELGGVCLQREPGPGRSDWARLILTTPADPWRGHTARLSAWVRANGPEPGDEAHLRLGVVGGATRDTSTRPIRGPVAGRHAVAVVVPAEAELLEVWLVATGRSRACFDAVRLDRE